MSSSAKLYVMNMPIPTEMVGITPIYSCDAAPTKACSDIYELAACALDGTSGSKRVYCTCQAGFYGTRSNSNGVTANVGSCQACPSGRYSTSGPSQTSIAACNNVCPAGTYSNTAGLTSSTECTSCNVIGHFCPEGSTNEDEKCPKGTYADVAGLSACKVCPEGYYQPELAQTNCSACEKGTFLSDKNSPIYHGE